MRKRVILTTTIVLLLYAVITLCLLYPPVTVVVQLRDDQDPSIVTEMTDGRWAPLAEDLSSPGKFITDKHLVFTSYDNGSGTLSVFEYSKFLAFYEPVYLYDKACRDSTLDPTKCNFARSVVSEPLSPTGERCVMRASNGKGYPYELLLNIVAGSFISGIDSQWDSDSFRDKSLFSSGISCYTDNFTIDGLTFGSTTLSYSLHWWSQDCSWIHVYGNLKGIPGYYPYIPGWGSLSLWAPQYLCIEVTRNNEDPPPDTSHLFEKSYWAVPLSDFDNSVRIEQDRRALEAMEYLKLMDELFQ